MKRVYLDYAAATPIDKAVAQAMQDVIADFANPASVYSSGRFAKDKLSLARKTMAMFLGANTDEIVLTSGASESNNLAILGVARKSGKGEIISSKIEHSSIREPLSQLEKEGYKVHWCPVDKHGKVIEEQFKKLVNKNTILVSHSLANSEFGTVEDISRLAMYVHDYAKQNSTKILFHTDASAAALVSNCSVSRLDVDLLTLSSAKLYGPGGIGLLYVRRGAELQPLIFGGKQENGLRAGSETIFLAAGFAKALEIVLEFRQQDAEHYKKLYKELAKYFEEKNIQLNGHAKQRLYSLVSVSIDGVNGEDLVAYLDSMGFEVSTGAACEISNQLPSTVLLALGLSRVKAQGSLRISFGRSTKLEDVLAFTKAIDKTLVLLESQ